MDFGVMNMLGSDNVDPERNHGSGFLIKQDRSEFGEDLSWSSSKAARTDDAFEAVKTMSFQQESLLRSNALISSSEDCSTQHMLSFSSPNSSNGESLFASKNGETIPFRLYQQQPAYIRNAGYGSGAMNASIHSPFARYRGPFTPSQWMELEHQALIYKHIVANAPIPSGLLISLKKSLNLLSFSSAPYGPNSFGWGFHLGFGSNTDPEPGRCRRTDGKKWRCSRDAVPEQKYCERHINRGRHRSRKPVEGLNGHNTTTTKLVVPPAALSAAGGRGTTANDCNTLGGPTQAHKFNNLHPVGPSPSIDNITSRVQKDELVLKCKDSSFSIPKTVAFDEPSHSEFGSVSSDSLLYPWPKSQSDRATWPEEIKSDWTRLSMSTPMSSLPDDSLPELSLAHGFDPVQLGGSRGLKQTANWIPISWGNSMGGPLGEALNSTAAATCGDGMSKSATSALNLMSEVWDGGAQLGSSPTGVLQKSNFVSLSNSSSGSSPRGDKNGRSY